MALIPRAESVEAPHPEILSEAGVGIPGHGEPEGPEAAVPEIRMTEASEGPEQDAEYGVDGNDATETANVENFEVARGIARVEQNAADEEPR